MSSNNDHEMQDAPNIGEQQSTTDRHPQIDNHEVKASSAEMEAFARERALIFDKQQLEQRVDQLLKSRNLYSARCDELDSILRQKDQEIENLKKENREERATINLQAMKMNKILKEHEEQVSTLNKDKEEFKIVAQQLRDDLHRTHNYAKELLQQKAAMLKEQEAQLSALTSDKEEQIQRLKDDLLAAKNCAKELGKKFQQKITEEEKQKKKIETLEQLLAATRQLLDEEKNEANERETKRKEELAKLSTEKNRLEQKAKKETDKFSREVASLRHTAETEWSRTQYLQEQLQSYIEAVRKNTQEVIASRNNLLRTDLLCEQKS